MRLYNLYFRVDIQELSLPEHKFMFILGFLSQKEMVICYKLELRVFHELFLSFFPGLFQKEMIAIFIIVQYIQSSVQNIGQIILAWLCNLRNAASTQTAYLSGSFYVFNRQCRNWIDTAFAGWAVFSQSSIGLSSFWFSFCYLKIIEYL